MSLNQPDRRVVPNRSFGVPPQQPVAGVPAPQFPAGVGHVGQPVNPVDFFRRMPGGGTVYVKAAEPQD
ncbi:MAG TPA: hypothetical protein VNO31_11865 [Umezawaea sp.]|nr:hypothetical protein [Umezawaea sp.]